MYTTYVEVQYQIYKRYIYLIKFGIIILSNNILTYLVRLPGILYMRT